MPAGEAHAAIFAELARSARESGGSAAIFSARAADAAEHDALVTRFRADRARDYAEFADRAGAFFAEVEQETRLQKFTFAELEEIEDDLEKLSTWLGRIRARDFFPDERLREATVTLDRCGAALRVFAATVYAREGVAPDATGERFEEPGSGSAGADDTGNA